MDIKTYLNICRSRKTLKVARLDPYSMNTSEHAENELHILKTSLEYPGEHISDQSQITRFPEGNQSRQFDTMSLINFDNDR